MYPQGELNQLARRKAVVRQSMAHRRVHYLEVAAAVSKPLAWIDRAYSLWRQLAPFATFAAGPLAGVAVRVAFPRFKLLGTVLRWLPGAFGAVSAFRRARR
jgi:hypothetical protein